MFIILVAFSWICLYKMELAPLKGFNEGYLSRNDTTAVKGIFVFMVFLTHFTQYYQMNTVYDNPYKWIKMNSGQLVVVMFLFYSGYGIYESIKRKGTDYVKTFPKNRLLKTLLHLDIAVLIYLVFDLIIGQKVKLSTFLFSLIAWEGIGNSCWFMFAIMVQYIIVYAAFMLFRKKNVLAIVTVTVLSIGYIHIMMKFKQTWWYNTALCLPLGMIYSYCKDYIQKFVMKNNLTYLLSLAASVGLFLLAYNKRRIFNWYEVWMLSFALVVVFITMKVKFGNKALTWLGDHVFSIYILQRIPMILFENVHAVSGNRYIYFVVCFAMTAVMSELFDRAMGAIDKKLFSPKKKLA